MPTLTERALRAYFRTDGPDCDQPSGALSGVETAPNGRDYVVLRGGRSRDGICACYSIRADGSLRRVRRVPRDFRQAT